MEKLKNVLLIQCLKFNKKKQNNNILSDKVCKFISKELES